MKRLSQTSALEGKELQTFFQRTKNIHERERARALLKRIEGQPRKVVAMFFDINVKTLDAWTTQFNRFGVAGIKTKVQPGNNHLLTAEQKAALRQELFVERKKPQDVGLEGRFWTTETLRQYVKNTYGVVYKTLFSYQRLFAFIGFTSHKPVKVNKRRSEAARRRFLEMVKKNLNNTEEQIAWSW